jgi:membrane-bound lytic murein transglycosylase D
MTTPANYPDYQLKIPADAGPGIEEQLAALPKAKVRILPEFEGRHKIRPGECLSTIAANYRVSVADLAKANNISVKKTLIAGTWLQVPSRTAAPKTGSRGQEKTAATDRNTSRLSSAKEGASGNGDVTQKGKLKEDTATKQIASTN